MINFALWGSNPQGRSRSFGWSIRSICCLSFSALWFWSGFMIAIGVRSGVYTVGRLRSIGRSNPCGWLLTFSRLRDGFARSLCSILTSLGRGGLLLTRLGRFFVFRYPGASSPDCRWLAILLSFRLSLAGGLRWGRQPQKCQSTRGWSWWTERCEAR